MPEMPEVETIRRTLNDKVTGRRIIRIEMLLPRLIKWPSADKFQAVMTDATVTRLVRRGKYLLFYLDNGFILVVHLRMTGRLYCTGPDLVSDRFVRLVFHLDNGDVLAYADSRTLGTLYALPEAELWRIGGLESLGPEPLSSEFTPEYFREKLARRKGKIKALLLDQRVIGGLGNIYVDESLAKAGIHPERSAASLNGEETDRLYQAINAVIRQGITNGGTTFRDYRNGEGKAGRNQDHLAVYGRKGEPCPVCGTPIVKCQVAGRGTHYCPTCQH